jgi:hypothetical protein
MISSRQQASRLDLPPLFPAVRDKASAVEEIHFLDRHRSNGVECVDRSVRRSSAAKAARNASVRLMPQWAQSRLPAVLRVRRRGRVSCDVSLTVSVAASDSAWFVTVSHQTRAQERRRDVPPPRRDFPRRPRPPAPYPPKQPKPQGIKTIAVLRWKWRETGGGSSAHTMPLHPALYLL